MHFTYKINKHKQNKASGAANIKYIYTAIYSIVSTLDMI